MATVSRSGLLEISLILYGEKVGGDVAPYIGGVPMAPSVLGSKAGIGPTHQRQAVRVDRMTVSPAKVSSAVVAFYTPSPSAGLETMTLEAPAATLRNGGNIPFDLDL